MALSDIVTITITQQSAGLARAGFGVPLFVSETATFPERVRLYSKIGDVSVDFSDTTSAEYLCANAIFAQTPHPKTVMIARSALPSTQRYQINASTVAAATPYAINVKGKGVTSSTVTYTTGTSKSLKFIDHGVHLDTIIEAVDNTTTPTVKVQPGAGAGAGTITDVANVVTITLKTGVSTVTDLENLLATATSVRIRTRGTGSNVYVSPADDFGPTALAVTTASNDEIMSNLKAGLNAVTGKNYTATLSGAAGSQVIVVTASATGNWFSLEMVNVAILSVVQNHADPGIATTMAAVILANNDWYCLLTLYNSAAYIAAAAAWVETQQKIYLAGSNDTNVITTTVGSGDSLDALHTLAYTRSSGWYHPSPANFLAAAEAGACLPLSPGSETWMFKTLAGVAPVALTPTHRANITAKKANSYENTAGQNMTFNGYTADGRYIDSRRGLDSLSDDMSKSIFESLSQIKKVPFTNKGIATVENVMRGALDRAVRAGILASFPVPDVQVPRAEDVSDANKANRLLPDMNFTATLAGAVHATNVNGTVSL